MKKFTLSITTAGAALAALALNQMEVKADTVGNIDTSATVSTVANAESNSAAETASTSTSINNIPSDEQVADSDGTYISEDTSSISNSEALSEFIDAYLQLAMQAHDLVSFPFSSQGISEVQNMNQSEQISYVNSGYSDPSMFSDFSSYFKSDETSNAISMFKSDSTLTGSKFTSNYMSAYSSMNGDPILTSRINSTTISSSNSTSQSKSTLISESQSNSNSGFVSTSTSESSSNSIFESNMNSAFDSASKSQSEAPNDESLSEYIPPVSEAPQDSPQEWPTSQVIQTASSQTQKVAIKNKPLRQAQTAGMSLPQMGMADESKITFLGTFGILAGFGLAASRMKKDEK